jgi:hypothetical protein
VVRAGGRGWARGLGERGSRYFIERLMPVRVLRGLMDWLSIVLMARSKGALGGGVEAFS